MWEIEKQKEVPTEIWTGFTVQIVNLDTISSADALFYFYATSVLWLNHTTVCCTAGFVLSHVGVLVSDRTTACLVGHCRKTVNPLVCRTRFAPLPHSRPLPTFTTPQLSPSLWVREYVSTHLFDRSIWPAWWEIWRVTVGLSFGAETTSLSRSLPTRVGED